MLDFNGDGAKNKKIATILSNSGADIIALQECTDNGAAADIMGRMTNKDSFEVISYNGIGPALIYNKEAFNCLEYGNWLLAEKGNESNGEYQRNAIYAKLQRKSDGAIVVAVATHFDYINERANEQVATLISKLNETFPGARAVIMGDYNLVAPNGIYTKLGNAGFVNAQSIAETKVNSDAATFPSKGTVLDYIYAKGFNATKHEVIIPTDNPSDHRPVFAELVIS